MIETTTSNVKKDIAALERLGYDIEARPGGNRLVINKDEAARVCRIFELYLECGSVSQTIGRLNEMGWANKAWTTKGGRPMGGRSFNKSQMFNLLTNVAYLGKVKHKGDAYDGQHEAIIDADLFNRVGQMLKANRSADGRGSGNKYGALLKGLVRCKACGAAMIHHYASDRTKSGAVKHYRYYACVRAQKRGWQECPGPSLPADELERFVVDQIRSLGRDDVLLAEAVRRASRFRLVPSPSMRRRRRYWVGSIFPKRFSACRSSSTCSDLNEPRPRLPLPFPALLLDEPPQRSRPSMSDS